MLLPLTARTENAARSCSFSSGVSSFVWGTAKPNSRRRSKLHQRTVPGDLYALNRAKASKPSASSTRDFSLATAQRRNEAPGASGAVASLLRRCAVAGEIFTDTSSACEPKFIQLQLHQLLDLSRAVNVSGDPFADRIVDVGVRA